MPEDKKVQQGVTNYKYVNAPDFRTIYSNNAHFYSHLFDFSIMFGEVTNVEQIDENTGNVIVEDKVKITMSPLQAKIFVAVAQRQLQAYEQRFGELKFPAGVVELVDLHAKESPEGEEESAT